MRFGVLGPLLVTGDEGDIDLAGKRRRALLVRLLVSPNMAVHTATLAEDLWDGNPPAGAASTLQSHLSLVRRALPPGRITGRDGTILLRVDDGELDATTFVQELRQSRQLLETGDPAGSIALID